MIIEEGGMVMKKELKNGCNVGIAPLSGGGGGGVYNGFLQCFTPALVRNFYNLGGAHVMGAGSACPSPSGRRWHEVPDEGFIDTATRNLSIRERKNFLMNTGNL
ncbi:MAG: hypothetical protein LBK53_05700, partial [Heliobacteriaceae bacterium]|nr:hypothetical protein [Heliobacteriaceae bacterium]